LEIGSEYIPLTTDDSLADPMVGAEITLEHLEEVHIKRVLQHSQSLDAAARTLGIDPATLYRKRKRLNL
jgi:NtrC-family two-component system response regulator AlgB